MVQCILQENEDNNYFGFRFGIISRAMVRDEDYDSDSTVLLADFTENPEKVSVKRRRLSEKYNRRNSQATGNHDNPNNHIDGQRKSTTESKNHSNSTNKQRHISYFFSKMELEKNENSQVKNEIIDVDNNDVVVIISDSDDDDCVEIINENNEVTLNMKPLLEPKVTIPGQIRKNGRRATVHADNKSNIMESESVGNNKTARIQVLKPAAINSRRNTINFLESTEVSAGNTLLSPNIDLRESTKVKDVDTNRIVSNSRQFDLETSEHYPISSVIDISSETNTETFTNSEKDKDVKEKLIKASGNDSDLFIANSENTEKSNLSEASFGNNTHFETETNTNELVSNSQRFVIETNSEDYPRSSVIDVSFVNNSETFTNSEKDVKEKLMNASKKNESNKDSENTEKSNATEASFGNSSCFETNTNSEIEVKEILIKALENDSENNECPSEITPDPNTCETSMNSVTNPSNDFDLDKATSTVSNVDDRQDEGRPGLDMPLLTDDSVGDHGSIGEASTANMVNIAPNNVDNNRQTESDTLTTENSHRSDKLVSKVSSSNVEIEKEHEKDSLNNITDSNPNTQKSLLDDSNSNYETDKENSSTHREHNNDNSFDKTSTEKSSKKNKTTSKRDCNDSTKDNDKKSRKRSSDEFLPADSKRSKTNSDVQNKSNSGNLTIENQTESNLIEHNPTQNKTVENENVSNYDSQISVANELNKNVRTDNNTPPGNHASKEKDSGIANIDDQSHGEQIDKSRDKTSCENNSTIKVINKDIVTRDEVTVGTSEVTNSNDNENNEFNAQNERNQNVNREKNQNNSGNNTNEVLNAELVNRLQSSSNAEEINPAGESGNGDNAVSEARETNDDTVNTSVLNCLDNCFTVLKESRKNNDESQDLQNSDSVPNAESKTKRNPTKVDSKKIKRVKAGKEYTCPVCSCIFNYQESFLSHLKKNHNLTNIEIPSSCIAIKCAFCGVPFRRDQYNAHVKSHHPETFFSKVENNKAGDLVQSSKLDIIKIRDLIAKLKDNKEVHRSSGQNSKVREKADKQRSNSDRAENEEEPVNQRETITSSKDTTLNRTREQLDKDKRSTEENEENTQSRMKKFECKLCKEVVYTDRMCRKHREDKHPGLKRKKKLFNNLSLSSEKVQRNIENDEIDENEKASDDDSEDEDNSSDAEDQSNSNNKAKTAVNEDSNGNYASTKVRKVSEPSQPENKEESKYKYECKICKIILNSYYMARKHRKDKHPEMSNKQLFDKIFVNCGIDESDDDYSHSASSGDDQDDQSLNNESDTLRNKKSREGTEQCTSSNNSPNKSNNKVSRAPKYRYECLLCKKVFFSDYSSRKHRNVQHPSYRNHVQLYNRTLMSNENEESDSEQDEDELCENQEDSNNESDDDEDETNEYGKGSDKSDSEHIRHNNKSISETKGLKSNSYKYERERIKKLLFSDGMNQKRGRDRHSRPQKARLRKRILEQSSSDDSNEGEESEGPIDKESDDSSAESGDEQTDNNNTNRTNCQMVPEVPANQNIDKNNKVGKSGDRNKNKGNENKSCSKNGVVDEKRKSNAPNGTVGVQNNELNGHERNAKEVYVFTCRECILSSSIYDDVIRHCQNHYIGKIDALEKCATCRLSFSADCFEAHYELHDNTIKIINYSFKALFCNWNRIFNGMPLDVVKEIRNRSIYKSHCLKMAIAVDGPWNLTLYQCNLCETCVQPDQMERHFNENCIDFSYPCAQCARSFDTYEMLKRHEKIHAAGAKFFRVVTFNDSKDTIYNRTLFKASKSAADNMGKQM